MTKNNAYKVLNPMLALLAASQGATAFFKDSMTGINFTFYHVKIGWAFLALIIIHVLLNYKWVKANYFWKAAKKKTDYDI